MEPETVRLVNVTLSLAVAGLFMYRLAAEWRQLHPRLRRIIAGQVVVFSIAAYGSFQAYRQGLDAPHQVYVFTGGLALLTVALLWRDDRR